jgi:hypothetical protein
LSGAEAVLDLGNRFNPWHKINQRAVYFGPLNLKIILFLSFDKNISGTKSPDYTGGKSIVDLYSKASQK